MNALTLTGTAYDGFVNHRSWVRVAPSAQKNRGLLRIRLHLTPLMTPTSAPRRSAKPSSRVRFPPSPQKPTIRGSASR